MQIALLCLIASLIVSSLALNIRRKRYVVRSKRWKKSDLTWHLKSQNINEQDEYIIRTTLHRAFQQWEGVSALRFHEVPSSGMTDIRISFERGPHGDAYPFDGRDGVVAHAFFPRDGRIHFDADENWTLNSKTGVNLYQAAVHEIGHLLGLDHSTDSRAVMYKTRRIYDPNFGLGDDDVRAIHTLFPKRLEPPPATPASKNESTIDLTFPFPLHRSLYTKFRRRKFFRAL